MDKKITEMVEAFENGLIVSGVIRGDDSNINYDSLAKARENLWKKIESYKK